MTGVVNDYTSEASAAVLGVKICFRLMANKVSGNQGELGAGSGQHTVMKWMQRRNQNTATGGN